MAIYKGILTALSGGTEQLSTDRADNAFVRHEFIQIGNQRIKSVRVLTYHNKLLESVIGQVVTLSVIKGRGQYMVAALRLPDGTVERVDRSTVLLPALYFGFQRIAVAAFFVVVGLILGTVTKAPLITVVLVALALVLVVTWLRTWAGVMGARSASI